MFLARVKGSIWSTRKEETLRGFKFLVVQPITVIYSEDDEAKIVEQGNTIVAADKIGAGETEIVMVTSGSSSRQGLDDKDIPLDALVVGIVDKETFESQY